MKKLPFVQVKDLHISFQSSEGKIQAVQGVTFDIHCGETVAIVGESGCGKSVTAQALMRLIPSPPGSIEKGEIFFEGEDLLKKSEKQMRRIRGHQISMIFQDPMTSLNPTMKIGAQIQEALYTHFPFLKKTAALKTIELLHEVGISNPEKRSQQYPHELSGGMRQRVMIAIALACNPQLLIADEPTTALDVTIQAQILSLMKEIQSKKAMSILLITHDLGIVAGMCDKVIVMYAGKIVEMADVDTLFRSPMHPYTQGLLRSIPRLDHNPLQPLYPIDGCPPSPLYAPRGCSFAPRCSHAMPICRSTSPLLEAITSSHHAACLLKKEVSS